jgi:hypothetical protein
MVATMRLSKAKQDEIYQAIIADTYDKPFVAIANKKKELVKRNYALWFNQYEATIKLLPKDIFNTENSMYMKVQLPQDSHSTWSHYYPTEVICESDNSRWSSTAKSIEVNDTLLDEVNLVIAEDTTLENEKKSLKIFIEESLEKHNTTVKLRKAWEEYPILLKYIPAEPVRAPRVAKQEDLPMESVLKLDTLKQRLTQNLLES